MDLDSFLVSLYVSVDDWWKVAHPSDPPKPGRPLSLSHSEVLTLAILAQWPRFRSERDFWRFASSHLRSYFPTLCSQRLEVYGVLVAATPKDNAHRAWPEMDRRWAAGKRQIISQLKDLFALECLRAKTLDGLLARLAAKKIAAYTCGQWLNSRLGRPLRHLAALLV